MWGELHEQKDLLITLPETIKAGKANRLFSELGAKLHYDVYSFPATEFEKWQSESLLDVTLLDNGTEVDAQEDFNAISLTYPFASRPSSDQSIALDLIRVISNKFNGICTYQAQEFSIRVVQKDWDSCNDFLLKEWGEETGSKELIRMIHENYS